MPLTGPNYGGGPNFWLVNSKNLHDITIIIYLNTGTVGWFVGGAAGRRGSFDSDLKITIWFGFVCTLLQRSIYYVIISDEIGLLPLIG